MTILKGKETSITKNLSELEKQLGVDLKITKDGDLELSNLNDFKLVAGVNNVAQALFLKLGIEPGGLVYHPQLGVNFNIGEKVTNALQIRLQIIKTLIADGRFLNPAVKVEIISNTVIINMRVTLKNTGKEIPLKFQVVR